MSDQSSTRPEQKSSPSTKHISQGGTNKETTNNKFTQTEDHWKRTHRVAVWGVIGLFIYCGLTALLWWTSREGIHSGQRAYVLVTDVGLIRKPLTVNQEASIDITLKNTGLTPALDLQIDHGARVRETPIQNTELIRQPPIPQDLGAGQQTHHQMGIQKLGERTLKAIENGEIVLSVAVRIHYSDVFSSARHVTDQCMQYDPRVQEFSSCGSSLR